MELTSKEKAQELVNEMYEQLTSRLGSYEESKRRYEESKRCALVEVNNMIKVRDELYDLAKVFLPNAWAKSTYLEEVKEEIINLNK